MSISTAGLVLALASSLAWGGLDYTRKVLVGRLSSLALLFWLTLGSVPFFLAWGWSQSMGAPLPGYWLPAIASVVLNMVANLCFFEAMKRAPFSVTIPLLSLTPVFAALVAIPVIGEWLTWLQTLGVLLVVVGAFLLQRSPAGSVPDGYDPAQIRLGVLLMTVTAALWSATIVIDKKALESSQGSFHGVVLLSGVALLSLAVLVYRGEVAEIRAAAQTPWTLFAALVVSSVALATQFLALPLVPVGLFETLKRAIGNGLALLVGALLFREAVTPGKVLAAILMAVGAAAVLLG